LERINFLQWTYNFDDDLLSSEEHEHRLPPLQAKLLRFLLENANQLLTRDQLVDHLWADRIVNDDALSRNIAQLRSKLGDNSQQPIFIETVPKRGYKFIAPVANQDNKEPTPTTPEPAKRKSPPFWLAGIAVVGIIFLLLQLSNESAPEWQQKLNNAERFTADAIIEHQPEISKDGSLITFAHRKDGKYAVSVMGQDQQLVHSIEASDKHYLSPTLSPDNQQLLLAEFKDKTCKIVLVSLPSLTQEDLTTCSMPNESGIIDWSPNGQSFLYTDKAIDAQSTSIWLFELATKDKKRITFENDSKTFDSRPRFASNGQDIAFIRGTDSIRRLYKTSLSNTQQIEQLTTSNSIVLSHQWMDNDNYIIFDSNKRGDKNLWLLKVKNNSLVNLGVKDGQFPSVSSSNKLLFQEKKYQANLWQIDTSSQEASMIVESAKFDTNPSFSPNGKSFAFVSNRHGMSEIWQYNYQDKKDKRLLSVKNTTLTYPMWHANKNKLLVSALDDKGYYCLEFDIDEQKIRNLIKRSTQISRCSYGLNNQIYAITKKANEAQKLVMVRKKKIEEIANVDISSFKVLASGDILYTKAVEDGIYRLTPHDGRSVSVLPNYPNYLSEHWTVNMDNLIFVEPTEQKKGIWKFNLETSEQTKLSTLVPNTIGSSLTISPDEKQLIITRLDKVESDIYLSRQ